ncbi:hypothetical protein CK203_055974 [Vitis vinifera]|uniref:DUF4283 domain-containing protein n=1 Tax=Vitis vinifera TaxID=29760 RepID=A0A438GPU6_VITVI|nr:hypothetical protein CK203_055974 [Vitis vinifera]
MAEKLQQMGGLMRRKEHKQSEWGGGNLVMERSYAEVVMKQKNSDKNVVRMKVRKEEIQNNLRQLAHCIIGTWDPSSEGRVDLEPLGRSLAKMWGLKGNLGMARLEENKVLLEFEIMEEATWVMSFGERSIGGINLELERWNPRVGCLEEGEITKEIWPALRKAQENRCAEHERTRGEVRGEGGPRADTRVGRRGTALGSRSCVCQKERTGDKEGELGRESAKRAQGKPGACPSMEGLNFGPLSLGPEVGSKGKQTKAGLFTQGVTVGRNLKQKKGLMCEAAGMRLGRQENGGLKWRKALCATGKWLWMVSPKVNAPRHEQRPSESAEVWVCLTVEGERVPGSSHLIPFLLDRAPEGEHYDRSRSVGEGPQFEVPLCVLSGDGTEENDKGCWDGRLMVTAIKIGVRNGTQA